MRMCIIICQSQRDKGTGEPDEAISFMSGLEGGWGKRPAMDLARSLPSGCTMRRRPRRWRCVARRSGNRRSWSRWGWTGRRCVPSVETPIPSGVPPVASGSCAPASSHGEEHLPASPRRNAPHERRSTGEPNQGCRVPGDSQGTPTIAWRQSSRAVAAPGTAIAPPREGPVRPVPERRTEGGPPVISIARGGTNLVRPHQGAVSPNNAIGSAQGRVWAHRGALSPEHSR